MITLSGLEKNLNRGKRQVKSLISLILLLIFLTGVITAFYEEFKNPGLAVELPTPSPAFSPVPSPQVAGVSLETAFVTRVVDGDTIKLQDGRTLRYIGIDTPETVAPQKPVECFGKEASEANRLLVEGKAVWLEKDVSETDRYGRLLRYVYLDSAASLSAQVNYRLVAEGYAYASSYPPDVKWQTEFTKAQTKADLLDKGLWQECEL